MKITRRQLRKIITENNNPKFDLTSEEKAYLSSLSKDEQGYLLQINRQYAGETTLSNVLTINKIQSLLKSNDESSFNQGMQILELAAPEEFGPIVYAYLGFGDSNLIENRLIKYFLNEYDPGSTSHPKIWNLSAHTLATHTIMMEYDSFPGWDEAQGALGSMLQGIIHDGEAGEALRHLKISFIQYVLRGGEDSKRIAAAIYTYGITGEIPDWLLEE
jgi:hypothetical protein